MYSNAFADFRIKPRKSRQSLIGVLCLDDQVTAKKASFVVNRNSISGSGHEGIFVSHLLRGNRVGSGLISAARVILDEAGIDALLIDDIGEKNPGRIFYERLGGKKFKTDYPAMYMPTRETSKLPYVFS